MPSVRDTSHQDICPGDDSAISTIHHSDHMPCAKMCVHLWSWRKTKRAKYTRRRSILNGGKFSSHRQRTFNVRFNPEVEVKYPDTGDLPDRVPAGCIPVNWFNGRKDMEALREGKLAEYSVVPDSASCPPPTPVSYTHLTLPTILLV